MIHVKVIVVYIRVNTSELRAWVVKHDVEKKTIDSFWEYINSYEEEENEPYFDADVDKSKLELNLNSVGLFIDAWSKDAYTQYGFDYIISYLPVVYTMKRWVLINCFLN